MLYFEKSGAFGYTEAHNDNVPHGGVVGGFTADENGAFQVSGTPGWLACPATASQQANGQEYQKFAQLPQVSFPSGLFWAPDIDCGLG